MGIHFNFAQESGTRLEIAVLADGCVVGYFLSTPGEYNGRYGPDIHRGRKVEGARVVDLHGGYVTPEDIVIIHEWMRDERVLERAWLEDSVRTFWTNVRDFGYHEVPGGGGSVSPCTGEGCRRR